MPGGRLGPLVKQDKGYREYPEGTVERTVSSAFGAWVAFCDTCINGIHREHTGFSDAPFSADSATKAEAWLRDHHEGSVEVVAFGNQTEDGAPAIQASCTTCGREERFVARQWATLWLQQTGSGGVHDQRWVVRSESDRQRYGSAREASERPCEDCGNRQSPGRPRKRREEDGKLVCPACLKEEGGGKVHAEKKVAHQPQDDLRIAHCPRCGSGQIIARPDGSTHCEQCDGVFSITLQPAHPNLPQDGAGGEEMEDSENGEFPPAAEDEESENPFAEPDEQNNEQNSEQNHEGEDPGVPDFLKRSKLDEDTYVQFLVEEFRERRS